MNSSLKVLFLIFLVSFCYSAKELEVVRNINGNYLSKTVVVKLKEPPLMKGTQPSIPFILSGALEVFKPENFEQVFPKKSMSDLGNIVIINYSADIDPLVAAEIITKSGEVEWAEPKFVYSIDHTPNDPSYTIQNQYNLFKIKAAEAWDINKGDTSIVIGIVDTGIDWDHPDLSQNIWINFGEIPNNGIDDDANGYVDDVRGWDFAGSDGNTPDNNPMEDAATHGTFVSGVASAVTNNNTGIASIGYNSKLMAVKTSYGNSRLIIYGYEGIVYAADNGAKVINCSWGGAGFSRFGEEVINYATSKGALVVSAAGNDNSSVPNYPASYERALNVASTDQGDSKSSFSNYGLSIDVSAPGSGIYSTWMNDTYLYGNGTSYSSPLAAGLAALVFAQYPNYTPEQIAEQIRINADDISAQNPSYQKLLGRGRINAYNTLINSNSKSVRITETNFSDEQGGNGDGIFQAGETIHVYLKFKNYLSPTSNLNIYLENMNAYTSVGNAIFNVGAVATLDTFDNSSAEFTFTLNNTIPQNVDLLFSVNFIDGSYSDFQLIKTLGNPTYANHAGNNLALTITSKGTLGFNDYPTNSQGIGLIYLNESNMLFEGAVIAGNSSTKIINAARNSTGDAQDNDFSIVKPFTLNIPGNTADVEGTTIFNDDGAGSSQLGVKVSLHSYSYADPPNDNYIILRYLFENTSGNSINNFYAGLFTDWDLLDGTDDVTKWDSTNHFGYTYHIGGTPNTYTATALLSGEEYNFWGINNAGGDEGFQIYDGFSDAEKWQSISSGIGKPQAGAGDISNVISGGPYTIAAGETLDLSFAVAAAPDLNQLSSAVSYAREKYNLIVTDVEKENELNFSFNLNQNYPNPFNPNTTITFTIPNNEFVTLWVYDVLGNEVANLVSGGLSPGEHSVNFNAANLSSGIYFYKIKAGEYSESKKMILLK